MKINEKNLYAAVGKRLKHFRQQAEMTQTQLAERVGILRTSITNMESGKQKPPLSTLYKLCLVLGVEVSEFLPSMFEIVQENEDEPIEIGGRISKVPPKSAEVLRRLMQN